MTKAEGSGMGSIKPLPFFWLLLFTEPPCFGIGHALRQLVFFEKTELQS